MRWMVLLTAAVAILGWNGLGQAAQRCVYPVSPAGPPTSAVEADWVGDSSMAGCCDTCSRCGNGCGRCGGHRLAAKKAAVGAFNCQCRGSYKFPVPPQYTYHWPGMYSQQTMTEYNSPYRFPPLNPPEDAFGQKDQGPLKDQPMAATSAVGRRGGPSYWKPITRGRRRAQPIATPSYSADGAATRPVTPSRLMKGFYGVP